VGKASREHRRAKQLKDRERERRRRHERERAETGASARTGTGNQAYPGQAEDEALRWRPSAEELAGAMVIEAVSARSRHDQAGFGKYMDMLAGDAPAFANWPRIVERTLFTRMTSAVTTGWQRGWQPAEVARQVGRKLGTRHAQLAVDAMAGEMRSYASATVDVRFAEQMDGLVARAWWGNDDGEYLERWGIREQLGRAEAIAYALQTIHALMSLPQLGMLCPPPGAASCDALRAEGGPHGKSDQRVLDRVRALLAKAESTEFPEEAEALTARAQELMARHSIDEALLAASAPGRAGTGSASGLRLFIESPYEAAKAVLLDVIASANRCRAVWHKELGLGTVLGFPGDLQAVELMFTSLLVQATTALVAAGSRQDAWGRSRTRSFRQSFLAAYAQRIGERLAEAAGAAERQATAEAPGTNLLPVLAARNRAVNDAVEAMFPRLTRNTTRSVMDHEGWITGRAAADLANLHGRRQVTGDAA
jgi:Protein of unknown function (DUF2786)